jgi:hypothetical protein
MFWMVPFGVSVAGRLVFMLYSINIILLELESKIDTKEMCAIDLH